VEKKIQTKDEVLAELMAEHVALKKEIEKSPISEQFSIASEMDNFRIAKTRSGTATF